MWPLKCHVRNIDSSWVPGSPCLLGPYRELMFPLVHYCIWINKHGVRFMDEGTSSDAAANTVLMQPGKEVAYIFDGTIKQVKPELVDGFRPPEVLFKANTLEEIAAHIGVNVTTFKNTVQEFPAVSLQLSLTASTASIFCSTTRNGVNDNRQANTMPGITKKTIPMETITSTNRLARTTLR